MILKNNFQYSDRNAGAIGAFPMCLLLLAVVTASLFLRQPVNQAQAASCISSGAKAPAIAYDYSLYDEHEEVRFSSEILNYLNTVGSAKGLKSAIEAQNPADRRFLTARIIEQDITADDQSDILVSVDVEEGPTFRHILSLYTCQDKHYAMLDFMMYGNFYESSSGEYLGAQIEHVVDLNGNKRPEIVVREGLVQQKFQQRIAIYEWNGKELAQTFTTDYRLGVFGKIEVKNLDNNPKTLELQFEDQYGYGEETAAAVNEVWLWRPIIQVYYWDGKDFVSNCRYFNDKPETLYQAFHSAEAYRACGNYQAAMKYYNLMINDRSLESWQQNSAVQVPESITDQAAYMAKLEESYLIPFAYYRLIQLYLNKNNFSQANALYKQIASKYPKGQQGYQYIAMMDALLTNFKQTHDLNAACQTAQTAFETARKNGDDPGITYYMYPAQGDNPPWHYDFYWDSGTRYSADPDNLPGGYGGLVQISVCL